MTGLTDLIADVDAERPPALPRVCRLHAPLHAGSKHSPPPSLAHTNLEEAGPTLSSRLPCAEVWFSSVGWALGWLLAAPTHFLRGVYSELQTFLGSLAFTCSRPGAEVQVRLLLSLARRSWAPPL